MAAFFGIIHKDNDSDYGISFPDLPGCVTAGSTLDELDAMAREALRLHIEGLLEDGETLPSSSEYADIYAHHVHDEGFVGVILVTVTPRTKRVRVNISLSEADLRYIDAMANQYGLDRSGFMLFAAKQMRQQSAHDV
jgi:predicted RNase H-like HicB family nuclease